MAGDLPAWKARHIASQTICLPYAGATHVDAHLAPVAHRCSYAQISRLVDEAQVRYDPDTARARAAEKAEHRHLDIDTHQVSYDGTCQVHGELDLADALDLDHALDHGARHLATLGATETHAVLRTRAAGELARHDLTLTYPTPDQDPDQDRTPGKAPKRRQVILHVHLSDQAVAGTDPAGIARVEQTRGFVLIDQVKTWCTHPDTHVTIKPVLDPAGLQPVDAYEIPDRIAEAVRLRDTHCIFPSCTRRSRACDLDHTKAYRDPDHGGPPGQTSVDHLAPLCRTHHRLKTHSGWTYRTPAPGLHLWTSPHHDTYLVHPLGTTAL